MVRRASDLDWTTPVLLIAVEHRRFTVVGQGDSRFSLTMALVSVLTSDASDELSIHP